MHFKIALTLRAEVGVRADGTETHVTTLVAHIIGKSEVSGAFTSVVASKFEGRITYHTFVGIITLNTVLYSTFNTSFVEFVMVFRTSTCVFCGHESVRAITFLFIRRKLERIRTNLTSF